VYWTEARPDEGGRQVIVRWNATDGQRDVTPAPFNARTMAHEYGGGWYAVSDGEVFFANLDDGRIYRQPRDGAPVALTAEGPYRYGELVVDRRRNRLLCVREDMTRLLADAGAGHDALEGGRVAEPEDALVAIDLRSGEQTVLTSGYDFYNCVRLSRDGARMCWLAWRHPNMPWDGTELWLADIGSDGMPINARQVAGGPTEAIVQPEFAPDGSVVYASDRSGWWNLYRWTADGSGGASDVPVAPMAADFAGPLWIFGMSWYGIADDGTIVAVARHGATDELWMVPVGGDPERIEVPDMLIGSPQVAGSRVVYTASGPTEPISIVLLDLASGERLVLRRSFKTPFDEAYVSVPEEISFPTSDGQVAHALYYPPTNPDFSATEGERPPLLVFIHGGPTAQALPILDPSKQVFTSRGFGVVDVNYRGSHGYGREYRRALEGKWGVYDVDDCIAAARYLADRTDVDGERLAIRGGSAGGYTTLAAMVFYPEVFAAGASHYGVGDVEALARETHKFESRYLDRLVAPYPEGMAVYRERSPIHYSDRLSRPLLVLQGRDDKVVPEAQAEQIVAALRSNRVPHAYLAFAGEGHGFRRAANIRRALEAELSFYAQVFGFTLADPIEPVEVEFLR
jgi:dipeptidyl aminopeptidase/acylaminoacyl peptidase